MKALTCLPAAAIMAFGAALPVSPSFAQTIEATQVTTTSEGTVSEFGPQSIVVKTEAGRTPIRFISRDTTNYVDEEGVAIDAARVIPGRKVTVYYIKVGDTLVASKVMVRRADLAAVVAAPRAAVVQTTTTSVPGAPVPVVVPPVPGAPLPETTTTEDAILSEGTVAKVGPDEIMVTTQTSNEPRRFMFSPTTVYVDAAGTPVTFDVLKSGLPVKVYYTEIGGVLRASRVVVVRRPAVVRTAVTETAVSAAPNGPVVVSEKPPVVGLDSPPPVVIERRAVQEAPPERVVVKKHVVEDEPEHVVVKKHIVEPEPEHVVRKHVEVREAPPVVKKRIVPERHIIEKETTTTTTTTNGR